MMDPKTGKIRVRYVDVESEMYQTLAAYMIRLKPEDFDVPETVDRARQGRQPRPRRVHPPLRPPASARGLEIARVAGHQHPALVAFHDDARADGAGPRGRGRARWRAAVSRAPSKSMRFFTVGLRSVISPRRCASTASCGVSHLSSVIS